jgi:hypothetical protein
VCTVQTVISSTLRFLFRVTLRRHEIVEQTDVIHEPRKLPVVLGVEEVARLLDAAPGLKYKAALSVAIANSRLIAFDAQGVTFKWKDYRIVGRDRYKRMTLATDEFIRRFLIHVLPKGLHRIRHYGLFARGSCADNIARARELLAVAKPPAEPTTGAVDPGKPTCPCCGDRMIIIEVFERGATPRYQPSAPTSVIRIDTS